MSDLVWAAAIAATPPTLAVVLAAWIHERQDITRAKSIEGKSDAVKLQVQEVHNLTNDRLTKALEKIESLTTTVAELRQGK